MGDHNQPVPSATSNHPKADPREIAEMNRVLDTLSQEQLQGLRDVLLKTALLAAGTTTYKEDTMTDEQPRDAQQPADRQPTKLEELMNTLDEIVPGAREHIVKDTVYYAATLKKVGWVSYLFELDTLYLRQQGRTSDETEDRFTWLRLFLEDQPADKQLRMVQGLLQRTLADVSLETCIEGLRAIVDKAADTYETTQRVVLDKIDGREVSKAEQETKSAIITGVVRGINVDDTVIVLRTALETIAERNRTTPQTILGMIGSGLK